MFRPLAILLAIILALGSTEGLAYWWMHPKPSGIGQPVLCYRPQIGDRGSKIADDHPTSLHNPQSTIHNPRSSSHDPQSPSPTDNSSTDHRSPITDHSSAPSSPTNNRQPTTDNSSTFTFLPEIVAMSLPRLGATTGTVARIDRDDGATLHLAFFEWDLSAGAIIMEAFIHLPEECMGHHLGMKLVELRPPHFYQVDGETLTFDHTVLRDTDGSLVHAFKCTWVSGTKSLLGNGLRGGMAQWHQLHMKAARNRFLPAFARVAQGAVRGIPDPDQAWDAFQSAMLGDLTFETR